MPTKFAIPTKRVHNLPRKELDKAIKVRMEDLFRLDETRQQAGENIDHIQLLRKEKKDEKGRMKSYKERELIFWMPKVTKIKGGKFTLPWKGH